MRSSQDELSASLSTTRTLGIATWVTEHAPDASKLTAYSSDKKLVAQFELRLTGSSARHLQIAPLSSRAGLQERDEHGSVVSDSLDKADANVFNAYVHDTLAKAYQTDAVEKVDGPVTASSQALTGADNGFNTQCYVCQFADGLVIPTYNPTYPDADCFPADDSECHHPAPPPPVTCPGNCNSGANFKDCQGPFRVCHTFTDCTDGSLSICKPSVCGFCF